MSEMFEAIRFFWINLVSAIETDPWYAVTLALIGLFGLSMIVLSAKSN